MTLREKIEKIFEDWYKTYGFDMNKHEVNQIIDAILQAVRDVLPGKEEQLSNPPLHDYEDGEIEGWNSCLDAFKKILEEK